MDITIPTDLWEGEEQAVITNWLASQGAGISEGALIAEIMVEKVQYEVMAPVSGVLTILKQTDEIVCKGEVIGRIG